jgi:hypothetical protein
MKTHRFKAIHLTTSSAKAGISMPSATTSHTVLSLPFAARRRPDCVAGAFAFPKLVSTDSDHYLLPVPNCLLGIAYGRGWLRFVKSLSACGQLFDRPNLREAASSDGFVPSHFESDRSTAYPAQIEIGFVRRILVSARRSSLPTAYFLLPTAYSPPRLASFGASPHRPGYQPNA